MGPHEQLIRRGKMKKKRCGCPKLHRTSFTGTLGQWGNVYVAHA